MTYKELREKIFHSISDNYENKEAHNIASYLIEESLGWKKNDWMLHPEQVSEYFIRRMETAIERLKQNEPVQYVLGYAYFLDLRLKVNSSVLIPRPETEELVNWIVEECKDREQMRIIDIGTGSGCIALALKHKMKRAEICAIDFSEKALHIAIENGRRLKLDIHFEHRDITKNDKTGYRIKFDMIVSNPPYILPSEKNSLAGNVLDFEPHEALFTPDNDALFFYSHILEFAKLNLVKGGLLFFEIAPAYAEEIKELFTKSRVFTGNMVRNDMQGKQRMFRSVFDY